MIYINSKNRTRLIVTYKILSIALIYIAANSFINSRDFYSFLRIFIFSSSILSGYLAYLRDDKKGLIFFTALTVLFNPIFPHYTFSKDDWILIDVFALVAFVYSIVNYIGHINKPDVKARLIKSDANLPQSSSYSGHGQKYIELANDIERNASSSSLNHYSRLRIALILYRNAIACNPNLIEGYINIADITLQLQYSADNTDYNRVIDELNVALKIFPDEPKLYVLRGRILLSKSSRIIELDKEKGAHLILDGINDLTEYLKHNPEDEYINKLKGESYFELENINPAYIMSLYLEAGSRVTGKWMEYYAKKKQWYNPNLNWKREFP